MGAAVNACVKRSFLVFCVLFAVIGLVVIGSWMLVHATYHDIDELQSNMIVLVAPYGMGIVTIAAAVLGFYGGYKEKKWALILFFLGITVGGICLLFIAVPLALVRPQVSPIIQDKFNESIPLDTADKDIQHLIEILQIQLKCCGIFDGYRDWRSAVPSSCRCPSFYHWTERCESMSPSVLEPEPSNDDPDTWVFKESCYPVLSKYIERLFDVGLGIIFAFAALAFLGAILALVILCQIRRSRAAASPVVFSVNPTPPKYTELYNNAEN